MHPDPYKDDPNYLTVDDVAKFLRTTKNTVYKLLRSGELESSRRGRQYRIRKTDLLIYQKIVLDAKSADKYAIELPQSIIDSLARHLVSEIRKYYDTEEGQSAFKAWLKQREDT